MAIQFHTNTRNARLAAVNTEFGTAATMAIFTGAAPANCSVANSGTTLIAFPLPNPALAAASGGAIAKSGTWSNTATGTGTAGHFRIFASGGECKLQGTAGTTGNDCVLDNASIAPGQTVTVTGFTLTDGNA